MDDRVAPDLSVILITPDSYETIRKAVGYVRRQTLQHRIELVIVAPKSAKVRVDSSERKGFRAYRLLEIDGMPSLGAAKATGVRGAGGRIVAFIEEHVYPDPGWAEALIHAHESPWAAVGPVIRNARPDSLMSWADFIITYGQWMEPIAAGPVDILPGHNSSYKRAILLRYAGDLDEMLEVEAGLHRDMILRGHRIYLEPHAVVHHLGYGKLLPSLPAQFHVGRLYAADRAGSWSRRRRLLYAAGSPLIPWLKIVRLAKRLARSGGQRRCPYGALPLTLPGLICSGLGEMMGYAFGPGNSMQRMILHEFHRVQHL